MGNIIDNYPRITHGIADGKLPTAFWPWVKITNEPFSHHFVAVGNSSLIHIIHGFLLITDGFFYE
jgi:hypothetical protein